MSTYSAKHSLESISKEEFKEALSNLNGSYFELDSTTITFLIKLSKYVKIGKGLDELVQDIIEDTINIYTE